MKRLVLAAMFIVMILCCTSLKAAPVWNMPAIRIQPNGDTLRCFVTGDEFYQRLHDANNYTIVMDKNTGYFMYATMENGQLVPSSHIAGTVDPRTLGIQAGLTISYPELLQKRKALEVPEQYRSMLPKSSRNITYLNNIMIFIRFSDDTVYTNSLQSLDRVVNDTADDAVSMYNFFRHASYNHLTIKTHFYPTPQGNQILSYQDIHPRSFYCPQSGSNPNGYANDRERTQREFDMIERATTYINTYSPIDTSLNLDSDNDGNIDNICYVVKGTYTGWADLLWPHKFNLYDRYVYINGKRVNTFNFMLAGAGDHYFGPSTFCHEMTHTLTAPDLYHYYNWTDVHPSGSWDLMEQNTYPPQHQGAWMKYKYCGWITEIPTITEQGTYALASLDHPTNNCWKIQSPDPNQFYILEYRNRQSDMFERGLPGSGLIISRIDDRFDGNASFDKWNQFDEVFVFRPDGCDSVNGSPDMAYFSSAAGRSSFNPGTNPYPMLTQNIPDTTWALDNIHVDGDSLYFDFIKLTGCRMPLELNASRITGSSAVLTWEGYNDHYRIEYGPADGSNTRVIDQDSNYLNIWGLTKNSDYRFRVKGFCDGDTDSSIFSPWKAFTSGECYDAISKSIGNGSTTESTLPVATNYRYSYTQQIFTAIELGRTQLSINSLSFYYNSKNKTVKGDCKIYLGHTSRTSFHAQQDIMPIDSLTLVYSGPLSFSKGWCSVRLDSNFIYDGQENLVVAIDDNSGTSSASCKFKVTNSSQYNGISYYSDNSHPDPADPTNFVGIMARKMFRSNIRIEGCNANGDDNDVMIGDVEADNLTISTHNKTVKVECEQTRTMSLYDVTGRLIGQSTGNSVTFNVPQQGIYVLTTDNRETRKVVVF